MAIAEAIRPTQIHNEAPVKKIMPLSFVPEAKSRLLSPELISVAGHELNHALVALAHGAPIVSISVEPEGNSLGRTILGGTPPMETMKIIAAGGGVDTHDGHAEGYGSDKYKVDVLHHFEGGHSWESAKSQASGIVSMYSREVRRKAAEIIAYLGKVPGSLLSEIMLRAQMEVNEENGREEVFVPIVMPENKSENRTIIDTLPNNMTRIVYVVVGKEDEEYLLCGVCGGVNIHSEKCSNFLSLPELKLPRKGTIFSLN